MKLWKRYGLLMLVLFMVTLQLVGVASAVELVDANHACVFATEWSSDQDYHWFACNDMPDCGQKMGMAVHEWNDGELTRTPTEHTAGVITYTCTICKASKTEAVAAGTTVVTRGDLEAAIAEVAWDYYFKKEKLHSTSQT